MSFMERTRATHTREPTILDLFILILSFYTFLMMGIVALASIHFEEIKFAFLGPVFFVAAIGLATCFFTILYARLNAVLDHKIEAKWWDYVWIVFWVSAGLIFLLVTSALNLKMLLLWVPFLVVSCGIFSFIVWYFVKRKEAEFRAWLGL